MVEDGMGGDGAGWMHGWMLWWCDGGFIHLFPLWVEWFGLVERWNLPPFLSAEEHMGCSSLLHFFPLCLPCSPSLSPFPLSGSNSFELLLIFSWDPVLLHLYTLLDLVLLIMAIFYSEENVHFAH